MLQRAVLSKREEERESKMSERETRDYRRQLQLARNARKEAYRREMVAEKIQLESQRAEDLRRERMSILSRGRLLRSKTSATKQAFTEQMEAMRKSANFELPPEMVRDPRCPRCADVEIKFRGRLSNATPRSDAGDSPP